MAKAITSPLARLSFPSLFKPRAFKEGPLKFEATLLFPESADLSVLKKAVHQATVDKWGADKTKWPRKITSPFHVGNADKPDVEGYADTIFIRATNRQRPAVVGRDLAPITEESGDLQAGHYVRASLTAKAYDGVSNGVTFYLEGVMKVKDGPTFSGRPSAENMFADVEETDDASDDSDSDSGF